MTTPTRPIPPPLDKLEGYRVALATFAAEVKPLIEVQYRGTGVPRYFCKLCLETIRILDEYGNWQIGPHALDCSYRKIIEMLDN